MCTKRENSLPKPQVSIIIQAFEKRRFFSFLFWCKKSCFCSRNSRGGRDLADVFSSSRSTSTPKMASQCKFDRSRRTFKRTCRPTTIDLQVETKIKGKEKGAFFIRLLFRCFDFHIEPSNNWRRQHTLDEKMRTIR